MENKLKHLWSKKENGKKSKKYQVYQTHPDTVKTKKPFWSHKPGIRHWNGLSWEAISMYVMARFCKLWSVRFFSKTYLSEKRSILQDYVRETLLPGFSLNYDNKFSFFFCIVSKAFTPDTSNDLGSYYNKYIVDYMIADQVSWNKLSDKYMTWLYWCVRLCKVIWSRIWLLEFSFSTCRSYLIAYLQDDYVPRPGWGMRATSLQIVGKCSRHLSEVESCTIKIGHLLQGVTWYYLPSLMYPSRRTKMNPRNLSVRVVYFNVNSNWICY